MARILLLLLLLAPSPVPPDALRALMKRADQLHEEGRIEEAELLYRKLWFAKPTYKKAWKRLRAIRKHRIQRWIVEGKALMEKDSGQALGILQRAAAADPGSKAVAAAFGELGYEQYLGAWLPREEAEQLRRTEQDRGEARRKELELSDSFAVLAFDEFRFFTDVDTKQAGPRLAQMRDSLRSHSRAYREMMAPFGLRYPPERLDVVLFTHEADFRRYTKKKTAAGVYNPRKRAAFFIEGGATFSTLLHEMTHQLNHKVLGARRVAHWLEEGIADYFGAAYLTRKGRRIALGRADGHRLAGIQNLANGRGQPMPLTEFLTFKPKTFTTRFYDQAWGLTHYLLEGPTAGRLILFDIIEGGKERRKKKRKATLKLDDFERILTDHGLTVESLDRSYLDFYRNYRP